MNIKTTEKDLLSDICKLIDEARKSVSCTVNKAITILYWKIGLRINNDLLVGKRAAYGSQIVSELATKLQQVYGRKGFEVRNIRRMMQFASFFPDFEIVSELATQLSWSHFIELLVLKDDLQRTFYAQMCKYEGWGTKQLRAKIDGMLFERTAISKQPELLVKNELSKMANNEYLSPDLVFKSPYFLEFTGLTGTYCEKNLEDSLIVSLEQFIMELGSGFSFVERQKRMIIDGEDFYLDLLFYHRKLKRLVAIELKIDRFKAAYKGQMELYLRWLDKYEKQAGEESPIGLILCTDGGQEQIELLQLEQSGIKVSEYYTELPDKQLLKSRLRIAVEQSRKRWEENP